MPLLKIPTALEIQEDEKQYTPCNAESEIMLSDSLDLTDEIYDGLCHLFKKPHDISSQRFKKILYIKATLFNLFVSGKLVIDKIFDDLEKECAIHLTATGSIAKNDLLKKNLCPKYYKYSIGIYKIDDEDEIDEYYYYPIISKEILETDYPSEILPVVLKQQLQKHNVNIAISQKTATHFLQTDGWLTFFGIVPVNKAVKTLKRGMIFIDPPEYADTDSRLHGPYGHAIQEYLISKLLEGGYSGSLSVKGEPDITERELVQAEAWPVKAVRTGVHTLFDIMRERRPNKLEMLEVYPDEFYGFTSPDFVNQYLMLNPFRFPCLSTILYSQYALATLEYFKLMPGFDQLTKEQQLNVMNIHCAHKTLSNDVYSFITKHLSLYQEYEAISDQSSIMLKRSTQSLFRFSHTLDDGKSYLLSRKKAVSAVVPTTRKFHADEALLLDSSSFFRKNKNLVLKENGEVSLTDSPELGMEPPPRHQ